MVKTAKKKNVNQDRRVDPVSGEGLNPGDDQDLEKGEDLARVLEKDVGPDLGTGDLDQGIDGHGLGTDGLGPVTAREGQDHADEVAPDRKTENPDVRDRDLEIIGIKRVKSLKSRVKRGIQRRKKSHVITMQRRLALRMPTAKKRKALSTWKFQTLHES